MDWVLFPNRGTEARPARSPSPRLCDSPTKSIARVTRGTAKPGDDETAEVRWASIEDALATDLTDPWRHILTSVRDGRAFDDPSA
jgi:hypothetical protein